MSVFLAWAQPRWWQQPFCIRFVLAATSPSLFVCYFYSMFSHCLPVGLPSVAGLCKQPLGTATEDRGGVWAGRGCGDSSRELESTHRGRGRELCIPFGRKATPGLCSLCRRSKCFPSKLGKQAVIGQIGVQCPSLFALQLLSPQLPSAKLPTSKQPQRPDLKCCLRGGCRPLLIIYSMTEHPLITRNLC